MAASVNGQGNLWLTGVIMLLIQVQNSVEKCFSVIFSDCSHTVNIVSDHKKHYENVKPGSRFIRFSYLFLEEKDFAQTLN